MKMYIKKRGLRVFILISIILIIISIVSTIISWNHFNIEVEVPIYNESVPVGGGQVNFGIIPANESGILNSTSLTNENG